MNWQPMDTAPRDWSEGRNILLLCWSHPDDYDSSVYIGFWGSAYGDRPSFWCDWGSGLIAEYDGHEEFMPVPSPTHWQPLPVMPEYIEEPTSQAISNP